MSRSKIKKVWNFPYTPFLRLHGKVFRYLMMWYIVTSGPGSVDGIATAYGLDGPGI